MKRKNEIESSRRYEIDRRKGDIVSRGIALLKSDETRVEQLGLHNIAELRLLSSIGEGAALESAISLDGSVIAIWTYSGIHMHQTAGGRDTAHLEIDYAEQRLAISANNKYVGVAERDGRVLIWEHDSTSKPIQFQPEIQYHRVADFEFIPGTDSFVVLGHYYSHKDFDRDGSPVDIIDPRSMKRELVVALDGLADDLTVSPDGRYLAIDARLRPPLLWDLRSRKEIRSLHEFEYDVFFPRFSPDSLSMGAWDLETWVVSEVDSGQVIAKGSPDDRKMPEWMLSPRIESDLRTAIYDLDPYSARIRCLEFSPDGKFIVSGGDDNRIRVWEIETKNLAKVYTLDKGASAFMGNFDPVLSLSYSPSGELIAFGRGSGTVQMIKADSGFPIKEAGEHGGSLHGRTSVHFSPDGSYLASGGNDGIVRLWNVSRWSVLWEKNLSSERKILDIRFSPSGKLLGVGHLGGPLTILNPENGITVTSFAVKGPPKQFFPRATLSSHSLMFSPDDSLLFSDERGDSFAVYDLTSNDRHEISLPRDPDYSFDGRGRSATSTKGDLIMLGRGDGMVLFIDVAKRKVARQFSAHVGNVISTALAPEGNLFASAGDDGVIYIWGI